MLAMSGGGGSSETGGGVQQLTSGIVASEVVMSALVGFCIVLALGVGHRKCG